MMRRARIDDVVVVVVVVADPRSRFAKLDLRYAICNLRFAICSSAPGNMS